MEILIGFVAAVILLLVIFFIFKKPFLDILKKALEETVKDSELKTKEIIQNQEKIIDEKIKGGEKFLDGKKDVIKELVERINGELKRAQDDISSTEKERKDQYATLIAQLEEYKRLTSELKLSTDNLKNLLSNNQMRGKWGEEVAENLLKSIGFVKGQNYVANLSQETSANRPDFTIFLPDKTKINVDIKFPFKALLKYQEAKTESERIIHLKEFETDLKQRIKEVATRDYINPEEKTVDFVILFIPNEMIFSFVYEKMYELWNDAMSKKVIMAGPFSFTAILRMVHQSYQNFKYQENLYEIIKLIKVFEKEYQSFNEALDTLGDRLESTSKQYDAVSITRTKKLSSVVEKIIGVENLPQLDSKKEE